MVAGLVLLGLLASWTEVRALTGLADILNRKTLVVAMPGADMYPFSYTDKQGELTGLDVDLGRDIARKLGVEFVPDRSAGSQAEVIRLLVTDRADLGVSGLKLLLPHVALTSFCHPYLRVSYALMINRLKLAELGGLVEPVAVLTDTPCLKIGALDRPAYEEYVHQLFPGSKVILYQDLAELMREVASGRLIAGFCDEIESKTAFTLFPRLGVDVRLVVLRQTQDEVALAVNWRYDHFRAWINLYLET
ncbi:MAG: transporter substrate-binding domain-containing protein, partial [Thermodesulfobacteriota bacterium]